VIGGDDAGSVGDGDNLSVGDPGAGNLIFQELCASSHGPEGEGSVIGPALVGERLMESAFSDDEMAEAIRNGTGVMAAFSPRGRHRGVHQTTGAVGRLVLAQAPEADIVPAADSGKRGRAAGGERPKG